PSLPSRPRRSPHCCSSAFSWSATSSWDSPPGRANSRGHAELSPGLSRHEACHRDGAPRRLARVPPLRPRRRAARFGRERRRDLAALQSAGFDAVMFGNENDRPYELAVDSASLAAMAYVIGRLAPELRVPFGVNLLWD